MQPFTKNSIENNLHIAKKMRMSSGSEREALISTANEILGLNSWSHSITRRDIDYIDCDNGRYSVSISITVKVELKNGVYHEELGYGICNECDDKGNAIALAQKDAATQGLKEALNSFGGELAKRLNQSQNCRSSEVKVENCSSTETVFKLPLDISPSTEDKIKLERKRRQQKKKEEFLQQMKQKQIQINSDVSNKENDTSAGSNNSPENDFLETLDMNDALISTQEMDRVVQLAAAQPKPRMPLISSPPNTNRQTSRSWIPARPNKINNVAPRNMVLAAKNLEGTFKNRRM